MPQRCNLTQNERQCALHYLLAGQIERNVAAQVSISQSSTGRLWQLYWGTGDVQLRPGQGRLQVITEATDVCHLWHDNDGSTLLLS